MINNCASLALKFDGADDPRETPNMTDGIREMAERHNREIREIENETSPLNEGEWRILFIGFWDSFKLIFGYQMPVREYHFVLQDEDGSWIECDRGDKETSHANIYELIKDAQKDEIPYQFYAVKKTA